ncbi:MAG: phytanoyl-CoA dioxygenase family protein [Verrucomicrobiota bacterium]
MKVDRYNFDQLANSGFQLLRNVLAEEECNVFAQELSALFAEELRSESRRIGGVRNLLRTHDRTSRLARSLEVVLELGRRTGKHYFPVRAIFFDKTPEANWRVPWHQDVAIAVNQRKDTEGFDGWSVKDGVAHVIPPAEILAGMITVRIHLDRCYVSNGALRVIPKSHGLGRLSPEKEAELLKQSQVVCEAERGDALLMRPLLLHASLPAENPNHRRVLHIEYASGDLPNGLEWHERAKK